MDLIQDSYQIPDSSQKTSSILISLSCQYVIPRKNRFFFSGRVLKIVLWSYCSSDFTNYPFTIFLRG